MQEHYYLTELLAGQKAERLARSFALELDAPVVKRRGMRERAAALLVRLATMLDDRALPRPIAVRESWEA